MFYVAPNIVLAPNMTQNAERKHRTQNTNTAHIRLHTNVFCHFGFKMAVLQFMLKTIRGKKHVRTDSTSEKPWTFFKYLLITHKLGNNSNVAEMISLN